MSIQMITSFGRRSRRKIPALGFLICMSLLAGCATLGSEETKPPITVGEVIQMSTHGVPVETVIQKMRTSGTVYRLTAAQLAQLHDQGVPDPVINYMQQTYLDAVRQDESLQDWQYWTAGADGFWYGGPYYGWPVDWQVAGFRGRDGHDREEGRGGEGSHGEEHGGEMGRSGGGFHGGGGGFGGHGGGGGGRR